MASSFKKPDVCGCFMLMDGKKQPQYRKVISLQLK